MVRNLEESDVDKAVVLPVAADSPYVKRTDNAFVGELCAEYPDKLIGFASVNPLEEPDAAARFQHDIETYGLKGLKLHPRWQGFSVEDPRVVPLVEKAAELDVPVAIDTMLWKPTPLKEHLPINVDTLCKRVPDAKIIMCHAGGFHFMDALCVAVANDNVYLDTSVSLEYFHNTPFEDQFVFVLKQVGAHRLIYGSDHPQNPLKEAYGSAQSILAKHGFSDDELAQIFGVTITSLLPDSD